MEGFTKTLHSFPSQRSGSAVSGFNLAFNDGQSEQLIEFTNLVLKEVNPTFIYQWEGQSSTNSITGKGIFRAKDNITDQVIFWCQSEKWKNKVPSGEVEYGRVIKVQNDTTQKVKERHIYKGQVKNLMKHGKGIYKLQEWFRNGQIKTSTIEGFWQNDVILQGKHEDSSGNVKNLSFKSNIKWSDIKTKQQVQLSSRDIETDKKSKKSKNKDEAPIRLNLQVPM